MDERIPKYLEDIRLAIEELDGFFENYPNRFDVFERDSLRIRAVERSVEIIGEAINRILKINPDFPITHARAIIGTRNKIAHEYEKVEPEFLWGLVSRHIPALKIDVLQLLSNL